MPTTQQLQDKLIKKLKELFQLNQPDLDFGFYRIMHAKSEQITQFIENDLPELIGEAFKPLDEVKINELKKDYEDKLATAIRYKVAEPEEVDDVKEAKARYETSRDTSTIQGDIYDHLYRFFERYYDDGDFISRRYYTRETASKAAPFAIPYNGEEVKLHWANADQYYIKSTEYFTNYTINLSQAIKDLIKKPKNEQDDFFEETIPEDMKVTFRIIDATEGEHGNIKASDATKRFFIIHQEKPIELTESGELLINFEYRPDEQKTKQENTWRDTKNKEAVEVIINALSETSSAEEYLRLLTIPAPTDKDKNRPLLAKYINQYTSKNTMDYFIHKDLGSFLKRELDFYIKNEVMHLDDIENADVPSVESYLSKIRVMRQIAGKLIEFLAQMENFQKKLWLKKKFVVETNYCITLDRIPEELYPEIAGNTRQIEEWVQLYAINEIKGDLLQKSYHDFTTGNQADKIEFLRQNKYLLIDTAFYSPEFKYRLLAGIDNLDEQTDGMLIHSENFQALNLLQERYREQIKCVYIDPPYNAKSSEIAYKNSYKHSSWISLLENRIRTNYNLLSLDFVFIVAIDEVEQANLGFLLSDLFNNFEINCITIIHNPSGQQGDNFTYTHEFAYYVYPKPGRYISEQIRESEDDWDKRNLRDVTGDDSLRTAGANCFFPIYVKNSEVVGFGDVCPSDYHPNVNEICDEGVIAVYPIDPKGIERKWRFARNTIESIKDDLQVHFIGNRNIYDIKRLKKSFNYKSCWSDSKYSANNHGTQILNQILPSSGFTYPKSIYTVTDSILAGTNKHTNPIIIDYFAGSGTTGHAVINLNREDEGKRKYILVEMGDYFDTVLKPRIQKVAYSKEWKAGKPTARDTGVSHCFKYIRLESYEDTLNNLVFNENKTRDEVLENNPALKEDYLLHYMLDVETKESQSLLNIDSFVEPFAYKLKVKKPGSDQYSEVNVDLLETFNYLIGLRVEKIYRPTYFNAEFIRIPDPDLPDDQKTKLEVKGDIKQDPHGKWIIHQIEGRIPRNPYSPNDGLEDKVLIIWRNLTGNPEEDNLVLDVWFRKNRISTLDFEYDLIYVNGSNNLPNLKKEGEIWKVKLTEEEFFKQMWSTEGV
jgi:adenine-specific DNA-methyltransferase